ncbi:LCP family protein [Candidatus Saccharibacteria bacterium]|nr:LCP family protein [Candidatus Saccharibacteria bacterium]MCB9821316.1 LCP family protein [Candidatus Nomurabacteria bacterium]
MFKYRKHSTTEADNAQRSLDGFARSGNKYTEGFKYNNRQSNLDLSGKVDDEQKKQHRTDEQQEASFPGLSVAFQQGKTMIDLEGIDEAPRKKHKKRRRFGKLFKRLALASTVIVLSTAGYLTYKGLSTVRTVFKGNGDGSLALNQNIDPSLLKGEGDGRINIMLLGKGGETHPGGELTDSMIIASIDPFNKKAALLSIPRDLYVNVPGFWSMKINAAYVSGKQKAYDQGLNDDQAEAAGIKTLEETIETYIGVPIHYYIMIDFLAFEDAVDAVGGVTVDVKSRVYDTNFLPTYLLDIQPGPHKFTGPEVLFYVRSRYTSPRGDFDRAQRQREVLLALKDKILSAGTFANPLKISGLLDSIGKNVHSSLSVDELLAVYNIVKDVQPADIKSLSFVDDTLLVTTGYVGDQSVVLPLAGPNDFSQIQEYVRSNLVDGFITKEAATITVLNGSGYVGKASTATKMLQSYGYNVTQTADAPTSDYLDTIIIDNTNDQKPYTRSYLEKRFGVTAVDKSPKPGLEAYQSDFVIILGANEKSI